MAKFLVAVFMRGISLEKLPSGNMSSGNISSILSSDDYDELQRKLFLPTIIFLFILMVMGLFGNTLVLYIYVCRIRPSTTRCFIVTMAVLDLLNCVTSIPGQIIELSYSSKFGSFGLCEIMVTCVTFFSMSSAVVLLAVAADRYSLICHHLRRQLNPAAAKRVCISCCFVTVIFVSPTPFIYGPRTVSRENFNFTDCLTRDSPSSSTYHLIYTAFQLAVFMAASITLIVLYTLIWRQVRYQQAIRRSMSQCIPDRSKRTDNSTRPETELSTSSSRIVCTCLTSSSSSPKSSSNSQCVRYHKRAESISFDRNNRLVPKNISSAYQNTTSEDAVQPAREDHTLSCVTSSISAVHVTGSRVFTLSKESKKKKASRKMTFMLFLISVVFIGSYLPYLAVMFADEYVIERAQALFAILERSYFVQSVSNPIIYSFCNTNFRYNLLLTLVRKRKSNLR